MSAPGNQSIKTPTTIVNLGSGYFGPAIFKHEDVTYLAKKVFEMYDKDKTGNFGPSETANIMIDLYRSFNKNFSPSKNDIDSMMKKMDYNKDGIVTQADLENLIRKYLRADVDSVKSVNTMTTTVTTTTSYRS